MVSKQDLGNAVTSVNLQTVKRSPKLVIGILSKDHKRDELIYGIVSHFRGIRDGSANIYFARCIGIDDNTTTITTNSWTIFMNCSSGSRPWELCDKTLGWLKFAARSFPDAMFIAKSDDDSYIHVDRLLAFMHNLSWAWPSSSLYVGRGMQIYVDLHNGMCFGPVPFIGGMMEIFSPVLISELHCSNSVVGGRGEDFVLGHSLMHTQVQHVMISCDDCFHDKEIQLSRNSMVVHGFKAGSESKLFDVVHALNKTLSKTESYKVVTYKSHIKSMAPFHRWGSGCSNGCISVAALRPGKVVKLSQLLQASKEPFVVFDLGLGFEEFSNLSFELRSRVDLQRFPVGDPSKVAMLNRVSMLYNSTCVTWINV
jgi:hypothetical protein